MKPLTDRTKSIIGHVALALFIIVSASVVVYPAVTQIAGLAVAQSSTRWNNLKDMAFGDASTNGVMLQSPCLYNGASCDRQRGSIANGALVDVTRISGTITPSDAYTNPTTANQVWSLQGIWNTAAWDRQRGFPSADGQAITGVQSAGLLNFNGSTLDRQRSVSATNNTATTSNGTPYHAVLSTWSVTHTPAVATQATASKALGGGTVRHVATSVTICIAASGTAQTPILFHLRDGATGAGTILRTWALSAPINSGWCQDISGLNMTGSANTAMTIESAAAPAAAVQATVTLTGYSTS